MIPTGSIEIPICATCEIFATPKIPKLLFTNSWFLFNVDILNMADGLQFEIYPKNCQFGGAVGSGQLKYTKEIGFQLILCNLTYIYIIV